MLWHTDHMHALCTFNARIGIGQHIQHAATGTHLVQIALELLQQGIVGCHCHHRHLAGDKCQRTMLEFSCCVGLRVNVGNFLELQGTFHGNRVVQAAAQKERVFLLREVLRPSDDLWFQRQHSLQRRRQVPHGLEVLLFLQFAQPTFGLSQGKRQQKQSRQLRGERLGGSHSNLDAGTGHIGQTAFAHHGAGGDIANRQGMVHALRLCMAQRCQGVGSLTGLGDGDH